MEELTGLGGLVNRILSLCALGQRFEIDPGPQ